MFRTVGIDVFNRAMKDNSSKWPEKNVAENRLRPICAPTFTPKFTLRPGESVFTIGSCFARNVEFALAEHGFAVPLNNFKVNEGEFWPQRPHSGALNKYSPMSMLNELHYAFETPRALAEEAYLVEGRPNEVSDYQLHTRGTVSWERAIERRKHVKAAYREGMAASRVVVITLGMAEAWWDSEAEIYLNDSPSYNITRKYPERFFFDILDYQELFDGISESIRLLSEFRGGDINVILTVSPVPLQRTFSGRDVITANSYSKSVLRSVADVIARNYDFVDYYPSYESVMLSEPSLTWGEDQVHPTLPIIRHNVTRMIESYTLNSLE